MTVYYHHDSSETLQDGTSVETQYTTQGLIPTEPKLYNKATRSNNAANALENLFNNNVDFQTPNSKFKNFYVYLKSHPEVWEEYQPYLSYQPIANIILGPSRKYKYGIEGKYYILRHKQMGTGMDFWVVARQLYPVFNWLKWLDPFNHVLTGNYTVMKSSLSFFRAKYSEQDGRYSIEEIRDVGDYDNYMSIKS